MGQIKVAGNGNVGLAGTHQPAYKVDIAVSDVNKLRIGNWTNSFIDKTGSSGAICFYPEASWYLHLGKPNNRIGELHAELIRCNNVLRHLSDEKTKENIKPFHSPIEKIMRISAYTYNFKAKLYPDSLSEEVKSNLTKTQIGFLAQELEREFPELVDKPVSEDDNYYVNYIGMIPVLLEAIKEQQVRIESLQAAVSKQAAEIELLQEQSGTGFLNNQENSPLKNMHTDGNLMQNNGGKLFQNTPNPFTVNTEIRFEIPEKSASARLLIHDMQGAEIKSYNIPTKGTGNITIQGAELQAGMYMYTLLVNNTIVDTKKMILTK